MRNFNFQRTSLKKLKLIAFSMTVMMSSAFLYNNCSGKGFNIAGSGETDLASSSEPSVSAVTFRIAPLSDVNTNSIDFSYDISGANTSGVNAKCYLDQTLMADCSSPMDLSSKPDGDYTLTVEAANQNSLVLAQAKRSFRLDRRAPVLAINSAPSGTINTTSASIAFSVTDNFPGAVSYCSLDNAAFAVCTSPYSMSNLAQGAHNVKIYAQDKASNKSGTQTISFSVNTAVAIPSVAISQMPAAFSNSAPASFSFSGASTGSTIASYQCSIDNSAFAACSSPQAYSSLAEGSHSFSVKSIDATGQSSSPANYSFAIDLTMPSAPVVSSNQMNPTKSTSLNLTFNSTDSSGIAKYECKLDAGAFATCVSPQAFSGLSSASHSFAVRATDKAGNVSAEGSYSIVIDAVAPVVTISSQPVNGAQSTSASFAFSVSDALSGVNLVECQLDSQAYASCVSPLAYNNLAVGGHTFNLRGTDKAGNSATQSYSWTIAAAATPTPTATPTPPIASTSPTPMPSPGVDPSITSVAGAQVSPYEFGAKGDGVTNDTVAVQQAAAAANTRKALLVFPSGIFLVNDYIRIQRDVVGVFGTGGTLKLAPAADSAGFLLAFGIFDPARPGRFSIRNLTIDANNINNALPVWGQNASNVDIYNNTILNMRSGTSILFRAYTPGSSTGNVIRYNKVRGAIIQGNEAANLQWWGILVDVALDYPAAYPGAGQYWKAYWKPLIPGAQSNNNLIEGNDVDGSYYGISLAGSSNNTINKNTVTNNIRNISMQHASNNNIVTDNTLRNSESSSIHLAYGSSGNRIEGNDIVTTRAAGEGLLQAYVGTTDNIFRNNSVSAINGGRPTFMVYTAIHVSGNQFIGNTFKGDASKAYIGIESAWYTGTTEIASRAYQNDPGVNGFASIGSTGISVLGNTFTATSSVPLIYLGQISDPAGTYSLTNIAMRDNKATLLANGIAVKLFEATSGLSNGHALTGSSFTAANGTLSILIAPRGRAHFVELDAGQGFNLPP